MSRSDDRCENEIMEVNHDKLPAVAALSLAASRGGGNDLTGPWFVDCLQPPRQTPPAPPPESSAASPRTAEKGYATSAVEPTDTHVPKDEPDEPVDEIDEKEESDEPAADAQVVAAAATAPAAPAEADKTAAEELGEEPAKVGETKAKDADSAPTSPVAAVDPTVAAPEEPDAESTASDVALSALTSADAKEQTPAGTKVAGEKSKRGKAQVPAAATEPIESSSETDNDKVAQAASKLSVPGAQRPESTTVLGPTDVALLDRPAADDNGGSTTAKEPLAVSIDVKSLPLVDPGAPTPAVDPTILPAQADSSPPAGVAAAAPKPPAAFLNSKAAHGESSRPAGEIDPAKFLSRVVKAFESAQQRGNEVRLRLHPAELGALSIEVKIHDSVLTANVHAETPEAKAAIVDNLPALRERLADQGIRIDQFDVDLTDHSDRRQQSLDEQAPRHDEREQQSSRGPLRRAAATELPPTPSPRNRATGLGGLNVII